MTPKYIRPPLGFTLVMDRATTSEGDVVYNKDSQDWEPVDCINEYVSEYIAVARPLTQEEKDANLFKYLMGEVACHRRVDEMDNRELVWRALNTEYSGNMPCGGMDAAIFDEMNSRLFPEWDGDDITIQAWGWKTPDGDLIYLPEKYKGKEAA